MEKEKAISYNSWKASLFSRHRKVTIGRPVSLFGRKEEHGYPSAAIIDRLERRPVSVSLGRKGKAVDLWNEGQVGSPGTESLFKEEKD